MYFSPAVVLAALPFLNIPKQSSLSAVPAPAQPQPKHTEIEVDDYGEYNILRGGEQLQAAWEAQSDENAVPCSALVTERKSTDDDKKPQPALLDVDNFLHAAWLNERDDDPTISPGFLSGEPFKKTTLSSWR